MKSANDWRAQDLTPKQRKCAQELLDRFLPISEDYHSALKRTTKQILLECYPTPRQERLGAVCHLFIPDNTISIEELLGHLFAMSKSINQGENHNE